MRVWVTRNIEVAYFSELSQLGPDINNTFRYGLIRRDILKLNHIFLCDLFEEAAEGNGKNRDTGRVSTLIVSHLCDISLYMVT